MAAWLLLRHSRSPRTPLPLWSCFAFFGLTVNNVLLPIDLAFLTDTDLAMPRTLAAASPGLAGIRLDTGTRVNPDCLIAFVLIIGGVMRDVMRDIVEKHRGGARA